MQTVTILGNVVHPCTIPELNDAVAKAVLLGNRRIIANHNLHSLYLSKRDEEMRAFYSKAHIVHIDGMSLVYLGRLLGHPLKRTQRVTYVDWICSLMDKATISQWRVYYLGSKPGVAEHGAQVLKQTLPDLQIETHHGYFDPKPHSKENRHILSLISSFEPHLLLVGMGMPRQEHWVLNNLNEINANAILMSGACIDYIAGVVPTPPRWMGRIGFEWLYRLAAEPKRLWQRYLVEPWVLGGYLLVEMLHTHARISAAHVF